MKLKAKFAGEVLTTLPIRRIIRSWAQQVPGARVTVRALALAERPRKYWHRSD